MKISAYTKTVIALAALVGVLITTSHVAQAATDAKLSLTAPITGTIEIGKTQTVSWKSSTNAPSTVRINVIRKVGSNPNRYALVRTVSMSTKNDGSATWVPAASDVGSGLSLEVACTPSVIACQSGVNTSGSIAVVNSAKYANTAAAFQAIEASKNK